MEPSVHSTAILRKVNGMQRQIVKQTGNLTDAVNVYRKLESINPSTVIMMSVVPIGSFENMRGRLLRTC